MRTFYLFTHEPLDNFLNFSHEKLPKGTYGFIFEIRMGKKNNWTMVGREIGLISRCYFAKEYGALVAKQLG